MGEMLFDTVAVEIVNAADLNESWQDSVRYRSYGGLLLAADAEFEFKPGNFKPISTREFDREKCVEVCSKAVMAMEQVAGEPVRLGVDTLRRIWIMGLGPHRSAYYEKGRRFSSLADLREAVGSIAGVQRGKFDPWTIDVVHEKAAKIDASVVGKPKESDYKAAALTGDFPGLDIVNRLFGSTSALNESLGYPNVRSWDKDDYIEYGKYVWLKNGEEKFKFDTLEILAGRDRGPSLFPIHKIFGSIGNFREAVRQRIEDREQRLKLYRSQIADIHPDWYSNLSDRELLQRCARLELINTLAPDLHWREVFRLVDTRIVETTYSSLSAVASNQYPQLTTDVIIKEAKRLGLHSFIHPEPPRYADHLSVTYKELADRRALRVRK